MAHFMPELPSNIAAPLCSILLIFLLDWRMGLAALVTIPLGTLFFAAMRRGYGPRMENYMRSANEMNSALVEYVNGVQVIKAFNRSAASYGKYADSVRYFHDSTMAWWSQCWLWNAAARAVLPSTLLGTLPVGAWLYMEGSLSLHVFLVALVVPLGFIAPLMKVSEAMEQVSMIKGNLEQVTAFLKTPELVRPTEPAELGERCYQFEDVHFAYNEAEILHGISFQTQPGTMTAIVGPSGSGKSTIAKLMAGFWDVTSGTVHFGGQDIRSIPFGQLMGEISYVAQDNFLFDKSIRENIRMGNPDASDEEVEAAAKAANCHDFIMQLEQGYDTMAGDAGARLSGGERQRITIARAMLKQASVIILDEATAYADPENEALIQQARPADCRETCGHEESAILSEAPVGRQSGLSAPCQRQRRGDRRPAPILGLSADGVSDGDGLSEQAVGHAHSGIGPASERRTLCQPTVYAAGVELRQSFPHTGRFMWTRNTNRQAGTLSVRPAIKRQPKI